MLFFVSYDGRSDWFTGVSFDNNVDDQLRPLDAKTIPYCRYIFRFGFTQYMEQAAGNANGIANQGKVKDYGHKIPQTDGKKVLPETYGLCKEISEVCGQVDSGWR